MDGCCWRRPFWVGASLLASTLLGRGLGRTPAPGRASLLIILIAEYWNFLVWNTRLLVLNSFSEFFSFYPPPHPPARPSVRPSDRALVRRPFVRLAVREVSRRHRHIWTDAKICCEGGKARRRVGRWVREMAAPLRMGEEHSSRCSGNRWTSDAPIFRWSDWSIVWVLLFK